MGRRRRRHGGGRSVSPSAGLSPGGPSTAARSPSPRCGEERALSLSLTCSLFKRRHPPACPGDLIHPVGGLAEVARTSRAMTVLKTGDSAGV